MTLLAEKAGQMREWRPLRTCMVIAKRSCLLVFCCLLMPLRTLEMAWPVLMGL